MIKYIFNFKNINGLSKCNLIFLKKQNLDIETFNLIKNLKTNKIDILFSFKSKKKRPNLEQLKILESKNFSKDFNIFNFKSPLGLFSGCNSFTFRITFKEYKLGLKPAKFSLLLNQFNLNLERFIDLINEILINNYPLSFYEDFFINNLNDLDFKIHFFVILRTRDKYNKSSKFFIIPKGCFYIHLREQLWLTIFSDYFFIYSLVTYYNGTKLFFGLILILILYYIYKLINYKLTYIINKHKLFDYEERAFESFGTVFALNIDSFNLYLKNNIKVTRYSYFFSPRCLDFFMETNFNENKSILKFLVKKNQSLDIYFDLISINNHFKS